MTYPIQPGKIQAPALRDETLARTRLLDWLDVKIHSRVVFVIADAGYGKTTLLADFSRRTRLRTIWYRIDEEDRDWVGFLAHLVSAGREFDPDFAPRTAGDPALARARRPDPRGCHRDVPRGAAVDRRRRRGADLRRLPPRRRGRRHPADRPGDRGPRAGATVDRLRQPAPAVGPGRQAAIARRAGRARHRRPALLRRRRWSSCSARRIGRPLEPDVLTELAQRTEGWAASLTLVQAALRERSPAETRSFVRGLSGARDELHDYLAEEVVGDLPEIQQQFLMRTSILQRVTPELAQVATGLTRDRGPIDGHRGRAPRHARPAGQPALVRAALPPARARVPRGSPRAASRRQPASTSSTSRSPAGRSRRTGGPPRHHYAASGRWSDLQRVLESHLETIVASGAFSIACGLRPPVPRRSHQRRGRGRLLATRQAIEGDVEQVDRHAGRAAAIWIPPTTW